MNRITAFSNFPLFKDDLNRWKFFGVPRKMREFDCAAWYIYDEMNGSKKYYGGYNTVKYADQRGEIVWYPYILLTREIYLPMLPYAELIWLENRPN